MVKRYASCPKLHWEFIEYYNYERLHMALDYSAPAEVYFNNVPKVMD
jgi:transposase InsO family protein